MGSEKIKKSKRTNYGRLAGWVGIVCNLMLSAGKFIAGMISGSVSITADALNNFSDASSSLISLIGFQLSEKRADAEHPYGHARYEYISGFVVAILVIVIGIELMKSGIERIITPQDVDFTEASILVMIVSIAVKFGMMIFDRSVGKHIDSKTLIAAAADSRNDCIVTAAVLIAGIISHYTHVQLDGIMAAAVAAFILYSGAGLVKETMDPLIGNAPSPELVEKIRQKILSYPGVLGTHDLIVHDYGHGRKFATVHVEMSAEENVIESHSVIDKIERDFLRDDGINMLVHFDPVVVDDSTVSRIRMELEHIAHVIDNRLSIHDLRLVNCGDGTTAEFDIAVPPDFNMDEQELRAELERFAKQKIKNIRCIITVDRSFAAIPPEELPRED